MIQITIEQFEQLLPFVGAATEDVFHKMQPDFDLWYQDLVERVVGSEFESQINTTDSPLQGFARNHIILATFIDRLHSQDIIMTDNGFGVVSNDNIAPASQARVDALERELTYKRDFAMHNVINNLRRVEGWSETDQAHTVIRSMVWSPVILSRYCGVGGKLTFDDLAKRKADIETAESYLRKQFSDKFIEHLIDEERKSQYAPLHRAAKFKILDFIGASLPTDGKPADPRQRAINFENILRFVEENLDEFNDYLVSTAYKANHMQDYENKADDTTFFFAG